MTAKFIIELAGVLLAAVYYIVMLLGQKSRRLKLQRAAGELVLKTASPSKTKTVAVWCALPIVLAISVLVNYSALFVILMAALCALATFISCREDACNVNNGVYKTAIIGGGEIVPYTKIKSIASGAQSVPENLIMELELVDGKKLAIQFASAEEYKCAAEHCQALLIKFAKNF